MRFLLGVGKACLIVGLFGETGWVPLSLTIKFNILRFRNRLLKMEEGRLPFKMYAWSTSLAGNRVQNWATKTKGLLDSIGDSAGGLACTMDEAWDSLARLTLQDWERDLNSIPDNSETVANSIVTLWATHFHTDDIQRREQLLSASHLHLQNRRHNRLGFADNWLGCE